MNIVECPRCRGKGEVEKGIFGWRTCPRCGGSGKVEKVPKYDEGY